MSVSCEDMESTTPSSESAALNPEIPAKLTPWSYPTRMCRICQEDVAPTVTLYPPGLPSAFQRPVVEYRNDDEYGRLIRPCLCRGGMRYIHEHCLRRTRTEGGRADSFWKCQLCGHQFNFKRLTLQRYLSSKAASGVLTTAVIIVIMFVLGFVLDPNVNLYLVDPQRVIAGNEPYWYETIQNICERLWGWPQHFLRGFVSIGLIGLFQKMLLDPFQWWNSLSAGRLLGQSARGPATGRDRVASINLFTILVGVATIFYYLYRWVQAIINGTLRRIGNNIVDTQLSGDDDDIKPPAEYTTSVAKATPDAEELTIRSSPALLSDPQDNESCAQVKDSDQIDNPGGKDLSDSFINGDDGGRVDKVNSPLPPVASDDDPGMTTIDDRGTSLETASSSGLANAHSQGWSFTGF